MPATGFEFFVARRYLRAHRKEKVISVITLISIVGVAAGVMALVIALAVNNGFRVTLQRNLLGAMSHIDLTAKDAASGIEDWRGLAARVRKVPHVTAASPVLYSYVLLAGPLQAKGAVLKGIDVASELSISETLRRLNSGSVAPLRNPAGQHYLPIILGAPLAKDTGMVQDAVVDLLIPHGTVTPFAVLPATWKFRVAGIFETGFFDIDDLWSFTSLETAQKVLSLPDVVNQIEIRLDDPDRATQVARDIEKAAGPNYMTATWIERNRSLNNALRTEKYVTIITIGLIELVAALNIFITLVMMVMEKYRDIGILMSMGAKRQQIRRIFMLQGVLIGVVGTAIGLVAGYTLCYLANRYRWVPLDAQVYSFNFVPFIPRRADGIWIAGAAILVSFLATLYPARNATKISPAEVLRYE